MKIKSFFLQKPDNWKFWVFLALLFKGCIFILCKHGYSYIPGFWGETGGDTSSYLAPIDNLIKYGCYAPDLRMPGYGILYLPFALLFNKALACNILIVLQYIVAALTVYPLALIAKYIFKSDRAFYLTFYCYAISTYSNLFDAALLTESFTTSFLILSVFFLVKSVYNAKGHEKRYLLFSGLCFTETFFLRPVFAPLILLYSLVLIFFFIKHLPVNKIVLKLVVLGLPLLLFDSTWMVRNYARYTKIIPATKTIYSAGIENSYYGPLMTFVESWGGSDVWWDPNAEIRWFGVKEVEIPGKPPLPRKNISIPTYIYTSKFNYDSLLVLRKQVLAYIAVAKDIIVDSLKKKSQLAVIRKKCVLYANSVKAEKPFLYYVKAPLILTKKFLINSGTYNLFNTPSNKLGIVAYGVKLFYSLLYVLLISLGAISIILLCKKSLTFSPTALITGIVVYTIIIHPIIFRKCESRYFVPAYPFLVICAVYAIIWLYTKIITKREV